MKPFNEEFIESNLEIGLNLLRQSSQNTDNLFNSLKELDLEKFQEASDGIYDNLSSNEKSITNFFENVLEGNKDVLLYENVPFLIKEDNGQKVFDNCLLRNPTNKNLKIQYDSAEPIFNTFLSFVQQTISEKADEILNKRFNEPHPDTHIISNQTNDGTMDKMGSKPQAKTQHTKALNTTRNREQTTTQGQTQ